MCNGLSTYIVCHDSQDCSTISKSTHNGSRVHVISASCIFGLKTSDKYQNALSDNNLRSLFIFLYFDIIYF